MASDLPSGGGPDRITWSEVSDFRGENIKSFSEQERTLKEVFDLLESFGFAINSSRIRSYRDSLKAIRDKAALNRNLSFDNGMQLLCTIVELTELGKILKAAKTAPDISLWRNQLEKLISGTHARIPSKLSPAWDFQFETFIASVIQLSDYEVAFEEPDVIVKDRRDCFGIAAKRPKTEQAIKRNLDKAAKQINNSGVDGIIALDCSAIIANGKAITTTDYPRAIVFVKELLDRLMEQNLSTIHRVKIGDHVFGVLLSLHMPVTIVDMDWQRAESFCSAFRWTLIPLVNPLDPRFDTVLRFAKNCEKGLFAEHTGAS
jgi:hypothetical protein